VPKVVNRERRRGDLARAAARVIARIGLEGVTVQTVAAEAECSAGSIAHYFRNKDELLLHALRAVTEPLLAALREPREPLSTVESLREVAHASLPLDPARERDWRVRLAFWTRASGPPEEVQLSRHQLGEWRSLWERTLRDLQASGAIRPDAEAGEAASALVALLIGTATQLLVRPRDGGARQAEAVESWFRVLALRC